MNKIEINRYYQLFPDFQVNGQVPSHQCWPAELPVWPFWALVWVSILFSVIQSLTSSRMTSATITPQLWKIRKPELNAKSCEIFHFCLWLEELEGLEIYREI